MATALNTVTYITHFNNVLSIVEFFLSEQWKGLYLLQT